MKTENELASNLPADINSSILGKTFLPIVVALVPSGLFALLGFITQGLDKPGLVPPVWVIVTMIAVQTLGMISMAIVILIRYDLGFKRLMDYTDGQPRAWRKSTLTLSIACLLIFDILANVAGAFAGAGFLLLVAVPVFFAYLVCDRIAFAGLQLTWPDQHRIA